MEIVWFFKLLLLIGSFQSIFANRKFWRGRRFYGESRDLESNNEDMWFDQLVDHFGQTEVRTFKQRYFVNSEYYKPNGPVFLMIGGEGEASSKWMHQGAWIQYAKHFDALCFQLEHRFYGKSHPLPELETDKMGILSTELALADLAYFISKMTEKYNLTENSRWIAFGGSYPGSLAAWLREKYPHLVHGAVSSSGPLLAKIDFVEYYQVVHDSLSTYQKGDCVGAIKDGMDQVETMMKHMIGQRGLDEKFLLCDPIEQSIENPLDIANFYEALASNFAEVVQYNNDNRGDKKVLNIDDVCDVMCNQALGPPVTRLAEVNRLILKQQEEPCLDYKYEKMVEEMKNTSWDSKVAQGQRQWTYQTCTEFGFYQTSNDPKLLFGNRFPVEFFIKQCQDIFGERFNEKSLKRDVERTNLSYGAKRPGSTNVIYVNGNIDPWHKLSLTTSSSSRPTILINGTAHCANMYEPSSNDLPQLKDARLKIMQFLTELLQS
jgi:pimeloyl-ACP methyl ester carboxylesterase